MRRISRNTARTRCARCSPKKRTWRRKSSSRCATAWASPQTSTARKARKARCRPSSGAPRIIITNCPADACVSPRSRSIAATPSSSRTSAVAISPKASSRFSAIRAPTAMTRWTGSRIRTGPTARSARWAVPHRPSGSWRWLRRITRPTPPWRPWPPAPGSAASASFRNRATGTPAACPAACSSSGSIMSIIRCAPSSPPVSTRPRAPASANITTLPPRSRKSTGKPASRTCPCPTCCRAWGSRRPPSTHSSSASPTIRAGSRAASITTTRTGAFRPCGSIAGTMSPSARTWRCSIMSAKTPPTRRRVTTSTPSSPPPRIASSLILAPIRSSARAMWATPASTRPRKSSPGSASG